MKPRLVPLAIALFATTSSAGRGPVDVGLFRPQASGLGLFHTEGAELLPRFALSAGILLDDAKDPLTLNVGGVSTSLVSNRLTATLLVAAGLTRWLEIGAAVPFALDNRHTAFFGQDASATSLGTSRLQLKIGILSEARHGLGLALLAAALVPTGNSNVFLGEDGIGVTASLLFEKHLGPFRLLANLGYLARREASFLNLRVGDEILYRFGLGWRLHPRLELAAEAAGATAAEAPFGGDPSRSPLEALVGVRARVADAWQVHAGAGPGIGSSYGTPAVRGFAGVRYLPVELSSAAREPALSDSDGDGVPDQDDQCPRQAGPRSHGGCPRPYRVPGAGLVNSDGASLLDPWKVLVGFSLQTAFHPTLPDFDRSGSLGLRLLGNLTLGLGLPKSTNLLVTVPVPIYPDPREGFRREVNSVNAAGMGLAFAPKLGLLSELKEAVGLALIPRISFPASASGGSSTRVAPKRAASRVRAETAPDADAAAGQSGFVFSPSLAFERHLGDRLRVVGNLGYTKREESVTADGQRVGDEIFYFVGLGVRPSARLELQAEVGGSTAADSPFGADERRNPTEASFAAAFSPTDRMQLFVGGGYRLTQSPGGRVMRMYAGWAYLPGAEPDTDKDGIPDKEDRCPLEPGPRENRGCPWGDADSDGVLDNEDRCPHQPGPRENGGCPWPDRDGDGVLDKDDRCPEVAGPTENGGCPWPDRDGDGVLDKDDRCPEVAGPKENGGCPWPDRDGDGVLDKDDRCPEVAGPKENGGCPWPDQDGDGVPDKDDLCPTLPGPKEARGCPAELRVRAPIQFRVGAATLLLESKSILDGIVAQMRESPVIAVEVQGHTDDQGSAAQNQRLSEQRAEAVRAYLVGQGIDRRRLTARGYGATRPVHPVDVRRMRPAALRAARAENRRVVFKVLLGATP